MKTLVTLASFLFFLSLFGLFVEEPGTVVAQLNDQCSCPPGELEEVPWVPEPNPSCGPVIILEWPPLGNDHGSTTPGLCVVQSRQSRRTAPRPRCR